MGDALPASMIGTTMLSSAIRKCCGFGACGIPPQTTNPERLKLTICFEKIKLKVGTSVRDASPNSAPTISCIAAIIYVQGEFRYT